jgi:hypothetical protein
MNPHNDSLAEIIAGVFWGLVLLPAFVWLGLCL